MSAKIIVIAGGPCSGKTQTLRFLQNNVSPEFAGKIRFIDEAASFILKAHPDAKNDRVHFQKMIYRLQLDAEAEACADEDVEVVICDRGKHDVFAYLSATELEMFDEHLTLATITHYEAVIFLKTSPEFFSKENGDIQRLEDSDEAIILAEKTKLVWKKHPRFIEIPTFSVIEEKMKYVSQRINEILGKDVFNIHSNL